MGYASYSGLPAGSSGSGETYRQNAVYGFVDDTACYTTPNTAAQGSGAMSVVLQCRQLHLREGGVGYFFGNYKGFGQGGYCFFRNNDRMLYFVTDAAGNVISTSINANWPNVGGISDFASGTTTHIVFTWDGTNARLYVSGRQQQSSGAGTGGYMAPSPGLGCGFGVDLYTATAGAFDGAIAGIAYHGNLVMSATQVFENYMESVTAGTIADTVSFENLWDFSQIPAGAAPATLPDRGSLGQDATLTGSLTVESLRPQFLTVGGGS